MTDLPTLGMVRYPPDAGATWKLADDGGQDAVVDAFLGAWRRLDRQGDRTRVRSALTHYQGRALLIYCRRRWMDGREGAFDALSVFDLNRLGQIRAEIEFTATVTVFISAARKKAPAMAAAPALLVAHKTMAALLKDLISRPPDIADLGHRWVWVKHPGWVLLPDRHPERPDSVRDPWPLVRMAQSAESRGYRVETVALNYDLPAVLLDAAADDPAVAMALDQVRERSGVRCGPGPIQQGGMTAHLFRTVTVGAATTIADAVTGRSTAETAVYAHSAHGACVIYIVEGCGLDYGGLDDTREILYLAGTQAGESDEREIPMPVPGPRKLIDTFLMIEVRYGDGPLHQWWLAGPPPHGTHPDPVGAWQALVTDGDPFRGFQASTQDYHGPEWATVRGFWRGTWVEHSFGRHVGAAAHQWENLRPFLEPTEFRPVRETPE
ncbi:hypothetical protein ACFQFC_15790 [Amorphoplanes digitatis]|uniref:Uncharacterized protein n=1 Tax=Actinoplanes digitatis TaxID=1868 RepID=A0A7W7I3L9_9ACTN|nr:hypothetical protein [Actinoplanes digitatis]MBB4765676.1 hypothetical protein [Actinoplanes digitatis]GID98612.1 hypothetical protein Adi01nite_80240 [Actinoplanes digitatis]